MIDVVFLLLIFFLVNSSFRPNERQVAAQTTDPSTASSASKQQPLVIRIEEMGEGFGYSVGGQRFRTSAQLYTWLKKWPSKSQPVILENPVRSPVTLVVQALNNCKRAGFETISQSPQVK